MLKRLYKRFLLWALAPVVSDFAERQSASESEAEILQAQYASIMQGMRMESSNEDSLDANIR